MLNGEIKPNIQGGRNFALELSANAFFEVVVVMHKTKLEATLWITKNQGDVWNAQPHQQPVSPSSASKAHWFVACTEFASLPEAADQSLSIHSRGADLSKTSKDFHHSTLC